MRIALAIVFVSLFWSMSAVGQKGSDQKGAKGLFYDPTSTAQVTTPSRSSGPKKTPPPSPPPVSTGPGSGPSPTPVNANNTVVNTGLMYYVELIKPSGEVLRVTSDRTFHSGERIRIHFTSNVDGRITVIQKKTDGGSQTLFPDARINGGNNAIKANRDTVLPSDVAFFKFDEKPGQEHLMVLLTANDAEANKTNVAGNQGGDKAVQIASLITREKGSKDLFVEVDTSPAQAATYVVTAANPGSELPQGAVAAEIVLNHQP